MKTSRFTDSQIIAILKQAEAGTPVPELCREHGMSSATFYKWRAKYGGMRGLFRTIEDRTNLPEELAARDAERPHDANRCLYPLVQRAPHQSVAWRA